MRMVAVSAKSYLIIKVGESDKATKGIDSAVSVGQPCVRYVMKHGLSVYRAILIDQVAEAGAELGGKFNGLSDGILGMIFVCVVIYHPYSSLNIGKKLGMRLDKIVTYEARNASHIVTGPLEYN